MQKLKNWISKNDYLAHQLAGLIITIIGGQLSHFLFGQIISGLIGLALGVTAGIWKEYKHDKADKKGVFSITDLIGTIWGSLVGTVLNAIIFNIGNGVATGIFD